MISTGVGQTWVRVPVCPLSTGGALHRVCLQVLILPVPVPVCLFLRPELTQLGDPLEPGGLDATGCRVPAGLLIVQKSWGLFQRKLHSISGEWNLKGPNPFFSPQTSNLVFVSDFENKYQKNPFLLCFSLPPLLFTPLCTHVSWAFISSPSQLWQPGLPDLATLLWLSRWPVRVTGPPF